MHFANAWRRRLFSHTKAFVKKVHTNSCRTKFTFTRKRICECTRNTFSIFPIFFSWACPQLFHDRARPTYGYAHRLRQNIYSEVRFIRF